MNPTACPPPTSFSCFSLTTTDHIAHLVLNRPQAMNTMSPVFWRELDQVLTTIHQQAWRAYC
jgi:enoyl-CoA hydratase